MDHPQGYNREDTWSDYYRKSGEEKSGETDFRGFADLFRERGMKGFKLSEKEISGGRGRPGEEGRRYPDDPQRSLDLHGMTVKEAEKSLRGFILDCREQGLIFIKVVTGLGRNSEGGMSKLRPMAVQMLTAMIQEQTVKNFKTAELRHGGFGAIYVYLK
jgi:hypothetical protein